MDQSELSYEELQAQNRTLQDKLKLSQAQLIQSEKMAALGQLIAGISHEINTPAGAIISSILEMDKDFSIFTERFLAIFRQLPEEQHESLLKACQVVLNDPSNLATNEIRQIAKEIDSILKEHKIVDTQTARNLASVGFDKESILLLLPLLKSDLSPLIQDFIFTLGMNKIHIHNIQIGINKIASLAKALTDYSRTEPEEIGKTNIAEDIEITLTILHNKLKTGITVNKEYNDIPSIRCYADQLNQVWTNIINNAIEAMKGKGQIIIRIKKLSQEAILVEIENNGPEIPKGVLPRIFDPYFTTKPKGEGTGLGLAISKEIVEKHGGKIEVESQPNRTLFRVALPIDVEQAKVNP